MLTLAALTAHAQRFDWVKTYSGPDLDGSETNNIVGSFVDAEGNFYFLGEFSPSASQSKYVPRIPKFNKQYHAQNNCTETIRLAGNKKRIGTFIWV